MHVCVCVCVSEWVLGGPGESLIRSGFPLAWCSGSLTAVAWCLSSPRQLWLMDRILAYLWYLGSLILCLVWCLIFLSMLLHCLAYQFHLFSLSSLFPLSFHFNELVCLVTCISLLQFPSSLSPMSVFVQCVLWTLMQAHHVSCSCPGTRWSPTISCDVLWRALGRGHLYPLTPPEGGPALMWCFSPVSSLLSQFYFLCQL